MRPRDRQAVAACANTPVTLDGEVREATKRMPTGQEGEDAALLAGAFRVDAFACRTGPSG